MFLEGRFELIFFHEDVHEEHLKEGLGVQKQISKMSKKEEKELGDENYFLIFVLILFRTDVCSTEKVSPLGPSGF